MTGQAGGNDVEVTAAGDDVDEPEIVDESSNGGSPAGSITAALQARYKALQGEQHIDLDVPGYGGLLVGRYKLIDPDWIKAKTASYTRIPEPERPAIAAMDQIIESCESLWFRNGDDLVPLDKDDPTIRYDHRLAAVLGFDAEASTPARTVVRKVFTVDGIFNQASVISHSQAIGVWMEDVSREVDEDYMGESQAAAT